MEVESTSNFSPYLRYEGKFSFYQNCFTEIFANLAIDAPTLYQLPEA